MDAVLVRKSQPSRYQTRRSAPIRTSDLHDRDKSQVRGWQQRSAAWHDRVYLWHEGGLSVGTSPSGLGKRVARVDRIAASEATGWQCMFDTWWSSPEAVPIQPIHAV